MTHPAGCHCQGPLDRCCSADHHPDPAGGDRVEALIEDYCRRTGQPHTLAKDAAWSYAWHCMTETLKRLDVILFDDGVPQSRRDKYIRYMLYGSPSEAEADLRIEMMDGSKQLLEDQLGMPPDGAESPAAGSSG